MLELTPQELALRLQQTPLQGSTSASRGKWPWRRFPVHGTSP